MPAVYRALKSRWQRPLARAKVDVAEKNGAYLSRQGRARAPQRARIRQGDPQLTLPKKAAAQRKQISIQ
jgi:hypothetical protein